MKYIEEGKDTENITCWFLMEDADLIGVYYSYEEAQENL